MTTTNTKRAAELQKLILELESTPRALIGSDEGTHGTPRNHSVYEEITGEQYAVSSFGGANGSRCSVEDAKNDTKGRIRDFTGAISDIRAKQRQLKAVKEELARIR